MHDEVAGTAGDEGYLGAGLGLAGRVARLVLVGGHLLLSLTNKHELKSL